MKQTKKELLKRIEVLEERVKQLEDAERQRNLITITFPKQELPFEPQPWRPEPGRTWPGPITIEPCIHEFPSHMYSPDGYYPCTKCGKSFLVGTIITCSTVGHVQ